MPNNTKNIDTLIDENNQVRAKGIPEDTKRGLLGWFYDKLEDSFAPSTDLTDYSFEEENWYDDAGFLPSDSTALPQPGGQPNPSNISPAMESDTLTTPPSNFFQMVRDWYKTGKKPSLMGLAPMDRVNETSTGKKIY